MAYIFKGPEQLMKMKMDLSGHFEQSKVLIERDAVVVLVQDDIGDVHPHLQNGGSDYNE